MRPTLAVSSPGASDASCGTSDKLPRRVNAVESTLGSRGTGATVRRAPERSTISGLMDSFALMTSISLHHGVRLQLIVDKFTDTRDMPSADVVRQRFEAVIETIDKEVGSLLPSSPFRRPGLFYSLFAAVYDHMYGLGSSLKRRKPKPLPSGIKQSLERVSARIRSKELPEKVQDAIDKATADKARRDRRHRFIIGALHLEPANSKS